MPNIIEITDFHAPELDPYARLTQNAKPEADYSQWKVRANVCW